MLTGYELNSGFEQANKYVIMDANGDHIGYMAEEEKGMANMMARQWFRTHRSFVTHVFDKHENEVLRVRSLNNAALCSIELICTSFTVPFPISTRTFESTTPSATSKTPTRQTLSRKFQQGH